MSHIIPLGNDCSSDPTNTTDWKYLINISEVMNGHLLQGSCGAVENDVVIVDLDSVGLGVGLFGRCCLCGFELKEFLKVLKILREESLFENSRLQRKRTHISYVVPGQVFIHVFVDSRSVYVVRKDGELGWKDEVFLMGCWQWSGYRRGCSFSRKGMAERTDC